MKAIVTVIGYDTVGILAKVSAVCAENNANIIDVTQSVLKDMFTMVMLIDISDLTDDFAAQLQAYAHEAVALLEIPIADSNYQ